MSEDEMAESFRRLRMAAVERRRASEEDEKTKSDSLSSLRDELNTCVAAIQTLTRDSGAAHQRMRGLVESLSTLLQSPELAELMRFSSTFSANTDTLERARTTLEQVPVELRRMLPREVQAVTRRAQLGWIAALMGVVLVLGLVLGWVLRGPPATDRSLVNLQAYDAYVTGVLYERLNKERQAEIRQIRQRVELPPLP